MAGRGRGVALTVPAWMKDGGGPRRGAGGGSGAPGGGSGGGGGGSSNASAPVTDWARAESASGRAYWYSRATGRTTWDDPTAPPAPPAPQWVRVDGPGRPYYYDRVSRATRWDPPPGFVEAAKDAPQVAPAKPAAAPQPATAPPAAPRPVADQPGPAPQKRVPSMSAQGAPAGNEPPLPPGWVEYTAPSGRKYYHNAKTGATEWKRPSAEAVAQPAAGPTQAVAAAKEDPRSEAPVAPARRPLEHQVEPPKQDRGAAPVRAREPDRAPPQQGPAKRRRTRTRAPPRGFVARPKDKDGQRYLRDREAERYFLGRARKERDRLDEVDKRSRAAAGKGPRGIVGAKAARKEEAARSKRDASEYVHVKKKPRETSWAQRERFEALMRESGVASKSSWLETMARCTPDERYEVDIPTYGHRKLAYVNFVGKQARAEREANIIAKFKTEDDFLKLLDDCFGGERESVLSLQDCSSASVQKFESDPRFKAFGNELQRTGAVRQFFRNRERLLREKKLLRRRELQAQLLRTLFQLTDPDLRPPQYATEAAPGKGSECDTVKASSAGKKSAAPVTSGAPANSADNHVTQDTVMADVVGGSPRRNAGKDEPVRDADVKRSPSQVSPAAKSEPRLVGATGGSKMELSHANGREHSNNDSSAGAEIVRQSVSEDVPNSKSLNGTGSEASKALIADSRMTSSAFDVSEPASIPNWLTGRSSFREAEERIADMKEFSELGAKDRDDVLNDWIRELDVRARDLSRKLSKAFSEGVESLALNGRISFRALWREVSEDIMGQDFAKAAVRNGYVSKSALPGLFEDGIALFFSHVDFKADEFRSALKAARSGDESFVLSQKTTLEDLRKVASLASFLETTPDSVATALLQERQMKEAKRLEDCTREFEGLLRRRNVSGSTDWNVLQPKIEYRTAYKQLRDLVHDDKGVEAVFRSMVERRERRQKRSRTLADGGAPGTGSTAKRPKLGPPPPPELRAPQPISPEEEDSGWAAALSTKADGAADEQARREERERRKREILAASEAGANQKSS